MLFLSLSISLQFQMVMINTQQNNYFQMTFKIFLKNLFKLKRPIIQGGL